MRPRATVLLVTFGLLVAASLVPVAQRGPAPPARPGPQGDGSTLLPNGWRIAPTGRHLPIGDLPLAMVPSPDGRFVVITQNGYSAPALTVLDTRHGYVTQREPLEHAWLGLAWHPDGARLYASGGSKNLITELTWNNGRLSRLGEIVLGEPERRISWNEVQNAGFVAGLAVSADGSRLYAANVLGEKVTVVDLVRRTVEKTLPLPAEGYATLLSADGRTLYASVWGGARVVAFDTTTLEPVREIPVSEHPNAMLLSTDGARLFVACANTNAVWVIDTATGEAREQISLALYPDAPVGTTPNALALSPDGGTLLVANADNNTVAMVDIAEPRRSEVEGFLPVGWYPTGVAFDREGRRIFVLNGKGLTPLASPRGPGPGARYEDTQYIGALLKGAVSIIDVPGEEVLRALTRRVYDLTPYTDARRLAPPEAPVDSPVPGRVGTASPIKYVFYVIRENRTYDQVFGDLPQGNGDPSLTLFGEDVTPNAHALARAFVLFDNFYVDAEVSYDGHAFSTGAYATDVVEKLWPTNYGGRGGLYLSQGGWRTRTQYGNSSAPPRGYLWDFATRAGVSVRSYGEFAYWDARYQPVKASVPGLEGLVHPSYAPYDLEIPDNERIDSWLQEFREFERAGGLPRLSIIRLGNDHTAGTRPGAPTPRAMVAENDVALGRLVEAISRSRFWPESAIFVLEDDAQNGPDHVDSHRSVALVISPFVKRRAVDSTLYTTSSMLRTMELILGLEPMSQYDAAATPMYNAFSPTPDLAPYQHLPARVPLDERNDWNAPGARASLEMNLEEADMAPELELNEILWQSIHGAGARMPPPRRAAFVRAIGAGDD